MLKIIRSKETSQIALVKDPSEISGDNSNNARLECGRHFRKQKKEYLKEDINELARNNKRDLYVGINEFKRGYQPRSNLVKGEIADLVADSHNIWNGRRTTSLSY
jgi:hypothetical protein